MEVDSEVQVQVQESPAAPASNLEQLHALQGELTHFVEHGIDPEEEWYVSRYYFIELYSQLRWNDFAESFKDKDDYLYEFSLAIHMMLGELINEYSTRPTFTFELYCSAINSIAEVWHYYNDKFMGDEEDLDIVDLIESLTFMKT